MLATWYTVKLEIKGSTLNAYLDGGLMDTATDTSLTSGAIGVGIVNGSAQFDDVKVTAP
jgi:pectate lyase